MKLHVKHTLQYQYSQAVFLTPHYIYLYPKLNLHQDLLSYQLDIQPFPDLVFKNTDAEGNLQQIVCINNPCKEFIVESEFKIETLPHNPFDFIYIPYEAASLPYQYSEKELILLNSYLSKSEIPTTIHHFARNIASESSWKTTDFLVNLSKNINENFFYEKRIFGVPNTAEYTLLQKKGTCRDFAVLMISACHALGIAARFVSGYCYGHERQAHELHAWVEAYLPGAGWRGFDPTEGQMTDYQYITLATSVFSETISPVKGIYKGGAKSEMNTNLEIVRV